MDYLSELASQSRIGWSDVLDVATVSGAIYEFLRLIRGTRAAQMTLGFVLIVALFFVSHWPRWRR